MDQRLKIAVFIDFDNIEIGVKTTLHMQFDIAAILDGIKERGEVVTKVAYGDWKRAGDYGRLLSQHAIRMVQRNLTPGGDKNGADINLALDALEMAFTHDHINAFVIVGGDSDFITLVEKLKQYDKKVFVVGGRQFTSQVMQKNCHEFIAYENLVRRRDVAPGPKRENRPRQPRRGHQGHTAGEARPQGAVGSRGIAAARAAQEHAAAARFDIFRTRLRRQHVPRFHREGREHRAGHAPPLGPQHDGGRSRKRRVGRHPDQQRRCRAVGRVRTCRGRGAGRSRRRPSHRRRRRSHSCHAIRSKYSRSSITRATCLAAPRSRPAGRCTCGSGSSSFARWMGLSTSASGAWPRSWSFCACFSAKGSSVSNAIDEGRFACFRAAATPASRTGVPVDRVETHPEQTMDTYEAEPVGQSSEEVQGGFAADTTESESTPVQMSDPVEATEVIEIDDRPAPVKSRARARKGTTAGKPAPRKATGAKTTSRRRKTPAA